MSTNQPNTDQNPPSGEEKPLESKSSKAISESEQKLTELEQKNSELNDKLLRSLAELDNVRRRSREEIDKAAKFAISNFASDLVLIVENFFLACDNLPQEGLENSQGIKSFAEAVLMTKKELIKILEKNQVKRIFPLNEKFDHNFHEAVSYIESDVEEGKVAQVIQAGYTISERLIRPALVIVAKAHS